MYVLFNDSKSTKTSIKDFFMSEGPDLYQLRLELSEINKDYDYISGLSITGNVVINTDADVLLLETNKFIGSIIDAISWEYFNDDKGERTVAYINLSKEKVE